MTEVRPPKTLPFADLETAYEILAAAIDTAGQDGEALFLARLALVLAHETGDIDLFHRAVETALMRPDNGTDG
jgi:hypothetical protein